MPYTTRNLALKLEQIIKTRPLVYLNGARQVGKSTLCSNLSKEIKFSHISFDSPILLASAKSDPASFIENLPTDCLNIIDEVQFVPEIFPYLKMKIDKGRLAGASHELYLLTGSANIMALPKLSQALVGRMSILTLYPFSANEFYQVKVNLIDKLFNDNLKMKQYENYEILPTIINATYPEIALFQEIDRNKWFDDYLTTILNRDVKAITDIRNPEKMIGLLSLLSMRTGGLLNNTALASELGLDYKTYEKFMAFALNSFLVFNVKAWAKPNKLNKRFTKSPKSYFIDCNLLCYIMRRNLSDIYTNDRVTFGHIFENFIATELLKHSQNNNIELSHFRTQAGKEVDFVLENENSEIIGIEVKSAKSVEVKDCSGLIELKNITEDKFTKGLIIYLGNDLVQLADKIWAVPACYFWNKKALQ